MEQGMRFCEKTKQTAKLLILFFIGGCAYYGMEVIFRGYSHATMFILGGICFILCGLINAFYGWDMAMWKQQLICTGIITGLEFVFGVVFNLYLGWHIWDYTSLPFNLLGQICLPFMVLWFFLSIIAIVVDDWLRYRLFGEEKPRYVWF